MCINPCKNNILNTCVAPNLCVIYYGYHMFVLPLASNLAFMHQDMTYNDIYVQHFYISRNSTNHSKLVMLVTLLVYVATNIRN
jgi:hypothetical protein